MATSYVDSLTSSAYRFKSEIPWGNKKLGLINKMYQMRVIVPANGTVTAGARRGT